MPNAVVQQQVNNPFPTQITCPNCNAVVITETTFKNGTMTWLLAGGMCLAGYGKASAFKFTSIPTPNKIKFLNQIESRSLKLLKYIAICFSLSGKSHKLLIIEKTTTFEFIYELQDHNKVFFAMCIDCRSCEVLSTVVDNY